MAAVPIDRRSRLTAKTVMGAGVTSRSPIVLAVHRFVLHTGGTPLGRLWRLAYRAITRAAAAYIRWGEPDATVYVRGAVAGGDLVPGLSDIDTAVVLPADPSGPGVAGAPARARWRRLTRALPATELLLDGPMIYDDAGLRELVGTSALTYGLDGSGEPAQSRAGYFGRHANFDWLRTLERPGLYGATADWRLLVGPDRRPPQPATDAQLRRIAAWLELLFLWRWVLPVCIDSSGPRSALMCVKAVAEPARIWLWLVHGERASGRGDALQRAVRRIPEEEDALRRALDLHRLLADSPDPPLTEVVPTLVRMSARIAGLIAAEVGEEDATEVRLAGADPADLILAGGGSEGPRLLPLVDWRALSCPLLPDESFAPLSGDPRDPAVLGAAAASAGAGPYPALRSDGLMLLPAGPWWRTRLRSVKCAPTDPVSFALTEGDRVARFPDVRGWSAGDTARRAVAEHGAWLRGEPGAWAVSESSDGGGALGMLLTAARAALFLESVGEGDPELALTATETARRLGGRSSAARSVAEDALETYREFALRREQPPAATVSGMRELVLELPAYAADDR